MSRTVLRVVGGAAAGMALAAVAGCGPVRMGTAAVVGDHRIMTSQLNRDVASFWTAYNHDPAVQSQLQPPTAGAVSRNVLDQLVAFKLVDELARRQGITVTEGEIDTVINQAGGKRTVERIALTQGIPPNHARDFARQRVILRDYAQRLGGSPEQAQGRLIADVQQVAREVGVSVNPRFGTFDYTRLAISASPDTLSKPERPESAG